MFTLSIKLAEKKSVTFFERVEDMICCGIPSPPVESVIERKPFKLFWLEEWFWSTSLLLLNFCSCMVSFWYVDDLKNGFH